MGRRLRCAAMVLVVSGLLLGSTPPVWAAPERQGTTIHIVQWGEYLALIANRYGVTTNAIMQANGLTNPNFIYAGQSLIIPTGAAPAPPSGETTTYVVQRGDTLGTVAARF